MTDEESPSLDEAFFMFDMALELGVRAMHKDRVLEKSLRMPGVETAEQREAALQTKRDEAAADLIEAIAIVAIADAAAKTSVK